MAEHDPDLSLSRRSHTEPVCLHFCTLPPLQLSGIDLANGTVTRVGTGGVDHCQLRLNNWKGKYIAGVNAIGYGDHVHVYLGQGATPYHVYGGYVENLCLRVV